MVAIIQKMLNKSVTIECQGRSQKYFYTEAGNKDCARIFNHAPSVDKPRPFSGVYRDRINVESLLESRMVRKAVLLSSQRETSVLLS